MPRLPKILLAALVLVLPAGATAATLASRATELVTVLEARVAQIPSPPSGTQKKQGAAMQKALTALKIDATDLKKTLANAGKVVAALDKVFAADMALGDLEKGLVDTVGNDVSVRNFMLQQRFALLGPGPARDKAVAQSDGATSLIAEGSAAATRTARIGFLKKALSTVGKGEKSLLKSGMGPLVKTTAFDVDVGGDEHLHLPPLVGPPGYTVSLAPNDFQTGVGGVLRINATGVGPSGTHTIAIMVPDPGMGEHAPARDFTTSYRKGTGNTLPLVSGAVTITSWDPANGKVAGLFTLTFSDGAATVEVTNGRFSTTELGQ